ncbi:cytochrome P450 [Brevibacillus choshinensis]|uniref:cytochrome P450 n=1 Tax=Brevibacillus choshinensis TaxID=54911 RepID=UPI001EED4F35|nr:cytochrome P450 [Brevibacillus choshinensis]
MEKELSVILVRQKASSPEENWNGRFAWYEKMRKESPFTFDEEAKCWDVFSYDDIETITKNKEVFSSERPIEGERNILNLDPPRHTQLRALVSKAFTPRELALWKPRIEQITESLITELGAKAEFDLIRDLAYPLPVIVIADILGVPESDRESFKHWSDILVASPKASTPEAFAAFRKTRSESIAQMTDYFLHIIRKRQANPQSDLISVLVEAEIDGQKLTESEIQSFCGLLLAAGNETTTNLIGNTMYALLESPSRYEQLRKVPSLIPSAIEEGLRYRSPVQAIARVAKEDFDFGGNKVKAGQELILWIGSANRDETHFPHADQFLMERTPKNHLSFGKGIHFCLGAPLARMEGQIAFEHLVKRYPSLHLADSFQLNPIVSGFVYGLKSLALTAN